MDEPSWSANQEQKETFSREEWYNPPCGKRLRYIYCEDCDFRTVARKLLKRHAEIKHTSSTTAMVPPAQLPHLKIEMRYKCSMCNFQTEKAKRFQNHEALHRIKSAFQCPFCSYSISQNSNLSRHVNRQHPSQKEPNSIVENAESSIVKVYLFTLNMIAQIIYKIYL